MRKSLEISFNLFFWSVIIYLSFSWYEGFMSPLHTGAYFFNVYVSGNWYYLYVALLNWTGPFINFYLFYLLFVPRFLIRKKVSLFIFLALLSSYIIGYSFRLTWNGEVNEIRKIILFTIMALICGIIGGAIKGFFLWRNSIAERIGLEKRHLESKTALLLLKAQINPHFLFNSLNNIDILIQETPKIASEYLNKLSDILRYVLYETKEDETELVKEIDQIKNYIELQKIRTDNPHFVHFKVEGKLTNQKIAPMIFLPFVENAFKHSKNKTVDHAIDIEFEVSDNLVKMVCKNYYEVNQRDVIKNEGLGIETIKQRLLLLYPEHHQLMIDKSENWFKVTLSFNL